MDPVITAAIITAVGGILAALILKVDRGVNRIRGLLNGTKREALDEIERLYRQRVSTGKPLRRETDRLLAGHRDREE